MKLGVVALKIRTANTRFANRVVGAAELAAAQEYTLKDETAFVIPVTEGVNGPNLNDTWVNQKVREVFGVVCAIKNDTATVDKLGFRAYDAHEDVRSQLCSALLGWVIPGDDGAATGPYNEAPVYYNGGRIIDIRPDYLWYQFEFVAERRLNSKEDGVDNAVIAAYQDAFIRVFTQFKAGGDGVLPLTGAAPQLPTELLTPTFEELFNPQYGFGDGFSSGAQTLDSEAT